MRTPLARRLRNAFLALPVLLAGLHFAGGHAVAGTLYAAAGQGGVSGSLYALNSATGAATAVGVLDDAFGNHYSLAGLAFQPGSSVLYGIVPKRRPFRQPTSGNMGKLSEYAVHDQLGDGSDHSGGCVYRDSRRRSAGGERRRRDPFDAGQ